ncbi:MAG: hypothetical protein E4H38_03265 [Gemmatimonadales bacterium]|nr:MAG: hypothetical protein E4H38_03265 [Gemmatimonadales bacterium]
MRRCARPVALLLLLLVNAPLAAQLAPVGAPRGVLRLEIRGTFESADRRLFDGTTEDYLADFGSNALGQDRLPFLASADSILGQIVSLPAFRMNLGREKARGQLTIGTATLGSSLGITSRITIFASVPLVTTRVQANLRLDSANADAGINPAHPFNGDPAGQQQAANFFTSFTAALSTLDANIANGSYAGNPSLDSLARATSAEAALLRDQLLAVTSDPALASEFLPPISSTAGMTITGRVTTLQSTLSTLSVSGFVEAPVLADQRLTDPEFAGFVSNPNGRIAAFPIAETKLSRPGDMDVGATYTLLDHFDRPGTTGGARLALTAQLRLPTGTRDNPDNLLDVGTGNGRYEAGVSAAGDLGKGRIGARFEAGYLMRFSSLRVRRVSAPSEPYPEAFRLTNVNYDAGDVITAGVSPFLRLARGLALVGSAEYWRTGADDVTYSDGKSALPGISAGVMAQDSKRSALAVGAGLSYVGRSGGNCEARGKCGWPIEVDLRVRTVAHATGGRVPKYLSTTFGIRWHHRLWR